MVFGRRKTSAVAEPLKVDPEIRSRNRLSKPLTNSSFTSLPSPNPLDAASRSNNASKEAFSPPVANLNNPENRQKMRSHIFDPEPAGSPPKSPINQNGVYGVAYMVKKFEESQATAGSNQPPPIVPKRSRNSISALFNGNRKASSTDKQTSIAEVKKSRRYSLKQAPISSSKSACTSATSSQIELLDIPPVPSSRHASFAPGSATRKSIGYQGTAPEVKVELAPKQELQNSPEAAVHLEAVEVDSHEEIQDSPEILRAGTPSNLDYGSIGNIRLGSLRIVNGRASPAASMLSKHLRAPVSGHRDVSSEYAESDYGDAGVSVVSNDQNMSRPETHRDFSWESQQPNRPQAMEGTATPNREPSLPNSPDMTSAIAASYMKELPPSPYTRRRSSSWSSLHLTADSERSISPEPGEDVPELVGRPRTPELKQEISIVATKPVSPLFKSDGFTEPRLSVSPMSNREQSARRQTPVSPVSFHRVASDSSVQKTPPQSPAQNSAIDGSPVSLVVSETGSVVRKSRQPSAEFEDLTRSDFKPRSFETPRSSFHSFHSLSRPVSQLREGAMSNSVFQNSDAMSSNPHFSNRDAFYSNSIFANSEAMTSNPVFKNRGALSSNPVFINGEAMSSSPVFTHKEALASNPVFETKDSILSNSVFKNRDAVSSNPVFQNKEAFRSAVEVQRQQSPADVRSQERNPSPERLAPPTAYEIPDSGYASNNSVRTTSNEHKVVEKKSSEKSFAFKMFKPILKSRKSAPAVPTFSNIQPVPQTNKTAVINVPKQEIDQPKTRKKLQKRSIFGPKTQPVVQSVHSLENSFIPPVSAAAQSNLAIRSNEVPELERTFHSLDSTQNQASPSEINLSYTEVRFPSPGPEARSPARRKSWRGRNDYDNPAVHRNDLSQHEARTIINNFGTVASSIGVSPYDLVREASRPQVQKMAGTSPHDVSIRAQRPKSMMSAQTASDFARLRSRSINERDEWRERRNSFNDRGGIPGKNMRPTSVAYDAPPMPPLPSPEVLQKRVASSSGPRGPRPPQHSPRPSYVEADGYFDERDQVAPPPPSHSPKPMDVSPDPWSEQAAIWKAKRNSANMAVNNQQNTIYSQPQQRVMQDEPLYPNIPLRNPDWQQVQHDPQLQPRGRPYSVQPGAYSYEQYRGPLQQIYGHGAHDTTDFGCVQPRQPQQRNGYSRPYRSRERSRPRSQYEQEAFEESGYGRDIHPNQHAYQQHENPQHMRSHSRVNHDNQPFYMNAYRSGEHLNLQHQDGLFSRPDNNFIHQRSQHDEGQYSRPGNIRNHSRPRYDKQQRHPSNPYQDDQYYQRDQPVQEHGYNHGLYSPTSRPLPEPSLPNFSHQSYQHPSQQQQHSPSRSRPRPHSQAGSFRSAASSLAEELHPEHTSRPSTPPEFGRYSAGLSYGYEREKGFGGSAGTRTVSGKADASHKGVQLRSSHGVDLGDVPIMGVLKKVVA